MSSESRRFQRSGERPRSVREITADADPETPVRLGESRYHSAVELPSGEIVTLRCADIDAPGGRLHEAAAHGLRPCKTCQPPEYLADPDTEDVVVDRSASALEADLNALAPGDAVGFTWQTTSDNHITVEGTCRSTTDADQLVRVDAPVRASDVIVRPQQPRRPQAFADTDDGERPLGELLDVLNLADISTGANADPDEPVAATDGGQPDVEDDEHDQSNAHASAVAETHRRADDEDLEEAGIDPDAVDTDEEVADGE